MPAPRQWYSSQASTPPCEHNGQTSRHRCRWFVARRRSLMYRWSVRYVHTYRTRRRRRADRPDGRPTPQCAWPKVARCTGCEELVSRRTEGPLLRKLKERSECLKVAGSWLEMLTAKGPLPGGYMSYGFRNCCCAACVGPSPARSTFPLPAAAQWSQAQALRIRPSVRPRVPVALTEGAQRIGGP